MQNQQKQTPKRPYTGVDKLILAAMMEDRAAAAAAAAASAASGYMPVGRGIGYFGNTRDTCTKAIPTPSNRSERELYHLLKRANLLIYFGTFLNFGGDDVQQLSDADEDEFLEIMTLVGMTQKPLHVRRLQKALIEWREMKESECYGRRAQMNANFSVSHNAIHPMISDSYTLVTSSPSRSFGGFEANDSQNQQYSHEVIVGAPKRIRLMDHLHRSNEKSDVNQQQSSSPKSQRSGDGDEDRLIEVMESSHSDVEPDYNNDTTASVASCTINNTKTTTSSASTTNATCSSPQARTDVVHSKYGRYRALLQSTAADKESSSSKK